MRMGGNQNPNRFFLKTDESGAEEKDSMAHLRLTMILYNEEFDPGSG